LAAAGRRPADDYRSARPALRRTACAALETGELAVTTCDAFEGTQWFNLAPTIGEDIFLKLYTHGAQERNFGPLLNGGSQPVPLARGRSWPKRHRDTLGHGLADVPGADA